MGTLDPAITSVSITPGGRVIGAADPASSVSPAAHATSQGGHGPASRPTPSVVALAASLSGLLEGALIEALVLGRERDGGTVLKTAVGTFVAATPPQPPGAPPLLPAQARVVLEALSVGDLLQARLVSVDGHAPAAPSTLTLRLTALANRPIAETPPRRPVEPPMRGPRPAPPLVAQLQVATTPAPIRPGQTLVGVLQASAPHAPNAAPLLPGGSTVSLRVAAVALPGTAFPAVTGGLAGEVTIEGGPDHERPVLRLPGGSLRLPATVVALPGTQLAVELLATAPPTAAREPEPDRLVGELQGALAARAVTDPASAASLLDRLPAPGRKLTAAALLFLAAARQGDLGGWLDAAAPAPAANDDHEPLKRLAGAWRGFTGEADAARDSGDGWRPWLIPLFDGVGLRPLLFQLRRHPSRSAGGVAETRFLLDLDLSALGALQLDGLIRARRFDLILRGAGRLDAQMRRELASLFHDSLGAVGYAGVLSFQEDRSAAVMTGPRTVLQA